MAMDFSEMLININVNDGVTSSLNNIDKKIKATENYLKASNRVVKENQLGYDGLSKRIKDTTNAMELNNQKLQILTARKKQLEEANNTESSAYYNLNNAINKIIVTNSNYQNSIDRMTTKHIELGSNINGLEKSYNNLDNTISINVEKAKTLGDSYGVVEAKMQGLSEKISINNTLMERQKTVINDLTNSFGANSRQVEEAKNRYVELENRNYSLINSYRELEGQTQSFRNTLMSTSNAFGNFVGDFANKSHFIGTMFKTALIGSIASAITAIAPLMANLSGVVIGGVSSIANSIAGIGLGAIISKSIFSGVTDKMSELDSLNDQISKYKSSANGASASTKSLNSGLNTTNEYTQKNNQLMKERASINAQIKSIDSQILAIQEKEEKINARNQYNEQRLSLLETRKSYVSDIRDIEKEINKLLTDRDLMQEKSNQRAIKGQIAVLNKKIASSKYDHDETQKLIDKRTEFEEALKKSQENVTNITERNTEKRVNLEKQKQDKLKQIAKVQKQLNKLDSEYAKSTKTTEKDKLEKQRQVLQDKLSSLSEESSNMKNQNMNIDTPSIDSGDSGLEDLIKQRDELLNSMSPAQRKFMTALNDYKSWYGKFIKQFESPVFGIAITGLDSIKNILTASVPLINNTVKAVGDLGDKFNAFTKSSEFKDLMSSLAKDVYDDVMSIGKSLGNVGLSIGYLVKNTKPLRDEFNSMLVNGTKKFLNFSKNLDKNKTFQNFIKRFKENKGDISKFFKETGSFLVSVAKFMDTYGIEVIKVLNKLLPKLTNAIDSITEKFDKLPDSLKSAIASATVFGGILTAIGISALIMLKPFVTLVKTLKKILGLTKKLKGNKIGVDIDKKGKGGKTVVKNESVSTKNAKGDIDKITKKATSKSLGKSTLGILGGLGKGGIKLASKAFLPLTILMSAFDGFTGYKNTNENFGLKKGEKATKGQKLASVLGGVTSGLTLGILDEKTASKGIYKFGKVSTEVFKLIGQKSKESAIKSAKNYANFAKTSIEKIGKFNTASKNAFSSLSQKATEKLTGIAVSSAKSFDNIKTKVSDTMTSSKEYINGLGTKGIEVFKSLVDKVSSSGKTIKDSFSNIFGGIKKSLSESTESIANFFTKTLPDKISSVVGAFKKIGSSIASNVVRGFKSTFSLENGLFGFKFPKFANGTKGALKNSTVAMVNDGKSSNYQELIVRPDGTTYMNKGRNVLDYLQKGSQVINGKDTSKILKSIPKFANGTVDLSKVKPFVDSKSLQRTVENVSNTANKKDITNILNELQELKDNNQKSNDSLLMVVTLLTQLLNKDTNIYLDGKQLNDLLDRAKDMVSSRQLSARGL